MSSPEKNKKRPSILYSCYSHKSSEGEQFIAEHVFGYTLSGRSENYVGGKNYLFKAGDFRFFRKNQLTKYVKYPPPGGEYRAITVMMDQDTLRSISAENNLHAGKPYTGEGALLLKPNALFQNYMNSLTPYLDGKT